MCVQTWNVAVVRRWVEVATPYEIADAIDIPSPVGTALCMAAALKKDHEIGNPRSVKFLYLKLLIAEFFFVDSQVQLCLIFIFLFFC